MTEKLKKKKKKKKIEKRVVREWTGVVAFNFWK